MTDNTPRVDNNIAMQGQSAILIAARLEYIRKHGARFLFNNEPPPAPGWPRMRKGKIVS